MFVLWGHMCLCFRCDHVPHLCPIVFPPSLCILILPFSPFVLCQFDLYLFICVWVWLWIVLWLRIFLDDWYFLLIKDHCLPFLTTALLRVFFFFFFFTLALSPTFGVLILTALGVWTGHYGLHRLRAAPYTRGQQLHYQDKHVCFSGGWSSGELLVISDG